MRRAASAPCRVWFRTWARRRFRPKVSRGWYERFNANGANAEYVLQPPFGGNGHYVFTDAAGVDLWLPTVERFLTRHGIPFAAPTANGARA